MSTSSYSPSIQTTSNYRQISPIPHVAETLYQAAVDAVRKKEKYQRLRPEVIEKVVSARNAEDLLQVFESERLRSEPFGLGRSHWIKRYADIPQKILLKDKLFQSMCSIGNNMGGPLWGIICFLLTLAHGIKEIDENLTKFAELVRRNLDDFNHHYTIGHRLSDPLQKAFQLFYEVIVEFCLSTTDLIGRNATSKARKGVKIEHCADELPEALTKSLSLTLREQIKSVLERLTKSVAYVEGSADKESYTRIRESHTRIRDIEENVRLVLENQQTSSSSVGNIRIIPSVIGLPGNHTLYFTGRAEALFSINKFFTAQSSMAPAHVAVCGPPSMGKTQLALRYARLHQPQEAIPHVGVHKPYTRIVYVRANSMDVLHTEISNIAEKLSAKYRTKGVEHDYNSMVRDVLDWFHSLSNWLLIFDNVDSVDQVSPFIPDSGNVHVLYTTRSHAKAILLATDHIVDLKPMNLNESARLLRAAFGVSNPQAREVEALAKEIDVFSGGLPQAIDQIAINATFSGMTLRDCLKQSIGYRDMLGKAPHVSYREDNLAVGAVLTQALHQVEARDANVATFFRILACLHGSFIPHSMIVSGTKAMKDFFQRSEMRDDQSRSNSDPAQIAGGSSASARQHFFNKRGKAKYQCDKPDRRQATTVHARTTPTERIDFSADTKMHEYWESATKLKEILLSDYQNGYAINMLLDSGLMKRDLIRKGFWIHDAFAEFTTAYIQSQSPNTYQLMANLASTMIYLVFPTPEKKLNEQSPLYTCLRYLPQARSAHRHLKAAGGLENTLIGSELSRVIAFTLQAQAEIHPRSTSDEDWESVLEYHMDTLSAYNGASQLLLQSGISKCDIRAMALADWQREEQRGYSALASLVDCQMAGSTAPWRMLNTAWRIGLLYKNLNRVYDAEKILRSAAEGTDKLFGRYHSETYEVFMSLAWAQIEAENWAHAAETVADLSRRLRGVRQTEDGEVSEMPPSESIFSKHGAELTGLLSRCYEHVDDPQEAIRMLEYCRQIADHIDGKGSANQYTACVKLAEAWARFGQWPQSLFWWVRAVEVQLFVPGYGSGYNWYGIDPDEDTPEGQVKIKAIGYSAYVKSREETMKAERRLVSRFTRECVAGFRHARAMAGELSPGTEYLAHQMEVEIEVWERQDREAEEELASTSLDAAVTAILIQDQPVRSVPSDAERHGHGSIPVIQESEQHQSSMPVFNTGTNSKVQSLPVPNRESEATDNDNRPRPVKKRSKGKGKERGCTTERGMTSTPLAHRRASDLDNSVQTNRRAFAALGNIHTDPVYVREPIFEHELDEFAPVPASTSDLIKSGYTVIGATCGQAVNVLGDDGPDTIPNTTSHEKATPFAPDEQDTNTP